MAPTSWIRLGNESCWRIRIRRNERSTLSRCDNWFAEGDAEDLTLWQNELNPSRNSSLSPIRLDRELREDWVKQLLNQQDETPE